MNNEQLDVLKRRMHYSLDDWNHSESDVERLVYFISYLSPHNMHKGAHAIEELVQRTADAAYKEGTEHLVQMDAAGRKKVICEACGDVKPHQTVSEPTLEELTANSTPFDSKRFLKAAAALKEEEL